jgi:crossover junction endodeoxyribonuclease RuvC
MSGGSNMTLAYGIDPSTKTGLVGLDSEGNVIEQIEMELETGIKSTPAELWEYADQIVSLIPDEANVMIEGFSFGSSGSGVSTQYGIGFAIRFQLNNRGIQFIEATPTQVKKFASGKGTVDKANMVLPIFKKWGYEHDSDNVRDAYVLAQIAHSLSFNTMNAKYEKEVLESILEGPKPKKKKGRGK